MKRLFIFLVISILFSQTAWAFYDVEINNPHEQTYVQAGEQNDACADYDHCGHASAHLVGLFSNNTVDAFAVLKSNAISVKKITSSISYQPPVPPPTL